MEPIFVISYTSVPVEVWLGADPAAHLTVGQVTEYAPLAVIATVIVRSVVFEKVRVVLPAIVLANVLPRDQSRSAAAGVIATVDNRRLTRVANRSDSFQKPYCPVNGL